MSGSQVSASDAFSVKASRSNDSQWSKDCQQETARGAELLLRQQGAGDVPGVLSVSLLVRRIRHPLGPRKDRGEAPWDQPQDPLMSVLLMNFPSPSRKRGRVETLWSAPRGLTEQALWTATGKRDSPFNVL